MIWGNLPKDWAEDHTNLFNEHKDNEESVFIYTDGSLSYKNGTQKTGYGVTMFRKGEEITTENGAMGKFIEVYDIEMKALEVASKMLLNLFNNENTNPPSIFIISTNNTGGLKQIFAREGANMFIKILKKHYQQTCKHMLCPYMVPRTF